MAQRWCIWRTFRQSTLVWLLLVRCGHFYSLRIFYENQARSKWKWVRMVFDNVLPLRNWVIMFRIAYLFLLGDGIYSEEMVGKERVRGALCTYFQPRWSRLVVDVTRALACAGVMTSVRTSQQLSGSRVARAHAFRNFFGFFLLESGFFVGLIWVLTWNFLQVTKNLMFSWMTDNNENFISLIWGVKNSNYSGNGRAMIE